MPPDMTRASRSSEIAALIRSMTPMPARLASRWMVANVVETPARSSAMSSVVASELQLDKQIKARRYELWSAGSLVRAS